MSSHMFSRRSFVAAAGSAAAAFALPASLRAAAPIGPLEKTSIAVGLPTESTTDAPLYVGAARTWKEAGLDVALTSFRGEAEGNIS